MKMNYSSTFVFTLLLKTIKYTSILAKLNFSCTLVYTLILKFTKSIRNKAILFILFTISLYSYTQNTLCTLILRKLYFFNTLIFTFILTVAGVQQSLYSSTLVLTIESRQFFLPGMEFWNFYRAGQNSNETPQNSNEIQQNSNEIQQNSNKTPQNSNVWNVGTCEIRVRLRNVCTPGRDMSQERESRFRP